MDVSEVLVYNLFMKCNLLHYIADFNPRDGLAK